MSKALILDGLKYPLPLQADGDEVLDADGERFVLADGPEQAALIARQANSLAVLVEAAQLVYQEGFTDSYCGFCDRHAPKDRDGRIVGPLRHDAECIIEGLGAAVALAKGRVEVKR